MKKEEALDRLQALGTEKQVQMNLKNGAGPNQFGVKMGDIRALAKEIKSDHALGQELWATGNIEAQFLSTLIVKPKQFSIAEIEAMLSGLSFTHLIDWFGTNVVKLHPEKESVRERWMASTNTAVARMGWSLTAERIIKSPEGLDLVAILDRLDQEMPGAVYAVQWTMNYCLAEIGIRNAELRARTLAMGERIGAFKDYPTPKGCTSPYAPLWIAEMVRRAGT